MLAIRSPFLSVLLISIQWNRGDICAVPKRYADNSLLSQYNQQLQLALLRRGKLAAERAARLEAEHAAEVKTNFITTMSHELRSPLNSIIGFSDYLMKNAAHLDSTEELEEYAKFINQSGEHLLSIINSILDIAKIRSNTLTVAPERATLTELIDEIVPMVTVQAQANKIAIKVRIDKGPTHLMVDRLKFKQILINLLSNSIKYTPNGGEVVLAAENASQNRALITIGDNGVGMTEEEIKLALSPFGQVDNDYARTGSGTGLGLCIAKELTELHGGEFIIRSRKNSGTVVALTFDAPAPTTETDTNEKAA